MKKRINISIEYDTYLKAKESIKNLSRFVERGIENYYEKNKTIREREKKELSEEDKAKLEELIMIASVPWTD